jgi:hypothetical protein
VRTTELLEQRVELALSVRDVRIGEDGVAAERRASRPRIHERRDLLLPNVADGDARACEEAARLGAPADRVGHEVVVPRHEHRQTLCLHERLAEVALPQGERVQLPVRPFASVPQRRRSPGGSGER